VILSDTALKNLYIFKQEEPKRYILEIGKHNILAYHNSGGGSLGGINPTVIKTIKGEK